MSTIDPPFALLAELTHRCPLRCPYCSNPLELVRRSQELDTQTWQRVLDETAHAGALQVHFSGGEPTARNDIEILVAHAAKIGLYTNLITSGILADDELLARLQLAGLDHVQVSIQDTNDIIGDRVAGYQGAQKIKRKVAQQVGQLGMALTVNAVFHRQNMARVSDVIDWAVDVNAQRLEIANVQYYGWGLENRRNLMPRLSQLEEMNRVVQDRIEALKGIIVIDYVVPDYFARRPKACMNGWGRRFFNVMPNGVMIPCHAAQTIPDMEFENVQDKSVGWIWQHSEAFNRFRGTAWMPEPCRSCDRREIDWAGCRCQALALTGSASNPDPVCDKVEGHAQIREQAFSDSSLIGEKFVYRTFSGSR